MAWRKRRYRSVIPVKGRESMTKNDIVENAFVCVPSVLLSKLKNYYPRGTFSMANSVSCVAVCCIVPLFACLRFCYTWGKDDGDFVLAMKSILSDYCSSELVDSICTASENFQVYGMLGFLVALVLVSTLYKQLHLVVQQIWNDKSNAFLQEVAKDNPARKGGDVAIIKRKLRRFKFFLFNRLLPLVLGLTLLVYVYSYVFSKVENGMVAYAVNYFIVTSVTWLMLYFFQRDKKVDLFSEVISAVIIGVVVSIVPHVVNFVASVLDYVGVFQMSKQGEENTVGKVISFVVALRVYFELLFIGIKYCYEKNPKQSGVNNAII